MWALYIFHRKYFVYIFLCIVHFKQKMEGIETLGGWLGERLLTAKGLNISQLQVQNPLLSILKVNLYKTQKINCVMSSFFLIFFVFSFLYRLPFVIDKDLRKSPKSSHYAAQSPFHKAIKSFTLNKGEMFCLQKVK